IGRGHRGGVRGESALRGASQDNRRPLAVLSRRQLDRRNVLGREVSGSRFSEGTEGRGDGGGELLTGAPFAGGPPSRCHLPRKCPARGFRVPGRSGTAVWGRTLRRFRRERLLFLFVGCGGR